MLDMLKGLQEGRPLGDLGINYKYIIIEIDHFHPLETVLFPVPVIIRSHLLHMIRSCESEREEPQLNWRTGMFRLGDVSGPFFRLGDFSTTCGTEWLCWLCCLLLFLVHCVRKYIPGKILPLGDHITKHMDAWNSLTQAGRFAGVRGVT